MAGKLGPICIDFPLTTFSAKMLTSFPFKISSGKVIKQHLVQKELDSYRPSLSLIKKNPNSLESFVSFKRNPYPTYQSLNLF